ncbi:MAG: alpha/beta hydrolase fold domain-containing protein [Acidobacteriota bacterium]
MTARLALAVCLVALAAAQPGLRPGRKYTTVERLAPERLAAVQEARKALAAQRKALPPVGVYEDYPAVIHVHAEDAAHTRGTREEVLAAAKRTGIRAVFFTDHGGPHAATWHGERDGVLFFAGAENGSRHELVFPRPAPPLRFHSHAEGDLEASPEGWDGMEIYNRHADHEDDTDLADHLKAVAADPRKLEEFARLAQQYPQEIYGAGADYWPAIFARWDRVLATRFFTGIGAIDAHQNALLGGKVLLDPYEIAFRNTVNHILAREFTHEALAASLRQGRAYVSHDWLCDPRGFAFFAVNTLGVYEMGDTVPMAGATRLVARAPVPARWRILREGALVHEAAGDAVTWTAPEPGAYRVEAWLDIDGEQRPWIYSNAIRLARPDAATMVLPSQQLHESVEAVNDVEYAAGAPEDAEKHRLDIYRPRGATRRPVLFFLHGGAWVRGDRKQYPFFGNHFARAGYVVVVPSYRLAPKHPHPAQIEDAAAAFAWTVRNIAAHGGDPSRIFIAGHSAGGHLAALLAVQEKWLRAHGLGASAIRGVISISGVPDVTGEAGSRVFGSDPDARRGASPLYHVRAGLPPFLVTYCQWDYLTLPQQARRFHEALRQAGVRSRLVFVERENHISEMTNIVKPGDATSAAILEFLGALQ